MPKYLHKSQIIGEKGVAAFYNYCINHTPPIIWREETKNDFGIDGEIEIVKRNEDGKLEVTGEILKVQIKSTETGSYISNDSGISFDFVATKEDIQYWTNHKLSVVLVVYFVKDEKLYAKKVDNLDLEKSKKKMPITFSKKDHLINKEENSFLSKFSEHFKGRVNYDTTERLFTNIFKFKNLPRIIYEYNSKVKDKKEIYESEIDSYPEFILHSSKLYTFTRLDLYPDFYKEFVEDKSPDEIYFRNFLKEKETRNYAIELINKYFKAHCFIKGIGYNRDYNRYYFKRFEDKPIEKEEKSTYTKEVYRKAKYIPKSKSKRNIEREVVTRYVYYEKTEFYRHFAFEIYYFFDFENLFLSITPKYLFTTNGKDVLDNKKKITQYTNYMTSREFNQQVLNHIYFVFQFLSENKDFITLADFENCKLSVSKMMSFTVPFGIDYYISEKEEKKDKVEDVIQGKLFD